MASKRLTPLVSQFLRPTCRTAASPSLRHSSRASLRSRTKPSPFQSLPTARPFSTTPRSLKEETPSKIYTYTDITTLTSSPSPTRILIDVREPSELQTTGTIPGSKNIPIKSSADAFFLSEDEFEDRYGFPRPGEGDEVVFFCKAGVRSRAAAQLARQSGFGGKVAEYPGSWVEWAERGGEVEKVK